MATRERWTILQSCSSPSWGGLEMQTLQDCVELRKRSHRVILICYPKSRLEQEAQSRYVQTIPIALRDFPEPIGILKVRGTLVSQNIDIVNAVLSKDLWTLVPAVKLLDKKIPLLLTKRMGSYVRKKDPFHRWIYQNLDRVLAVSTVIKRNVLETCPISEDKIEVIHDGIDTNFFSVKDVDRSHIRGEFKVRRNQVLLGMVGRFSPGKGHEDFLEAMRILKGRSPRVRALIVGEASFGEHAYEAKIHELTKALGVGRTVKFTGFRTDIPDIMASLDIFVFPSHAEAFGKAAIEAMAMGKPVVSTNCDGVLDIVIHGRTGLQVPPRRPDKLAAAIWSLIKDRARRNKLGKAGYQRTRKYFSASSQLRYLLRSYGELLKKKQKG